MGMDWYAVNKRDATFFELGRGGWYVLKHDWEAFTDAEYLAHEILDTECIGGSDPDNPKDRAWAAPLAAELVRFAAGASKADLCIIPDNDDSLSMIRAIGYRCVGSRYGVTPEERQNHVEDQNKHLDGDRWQRSRHCPELFRSLRDFDDFDRGRSVARGADEHGDR